MSKLVYLDWMTEKVVTRHMTPGATGVEKRLQRLRENGVQCRGI